MRDIPAALDAAFREKVLRPVLLFELDHPAGLLRLWTGLGKLQWDGVDWTGAGYLIGTSGAEESTELQVSSATFSLVAPDLSDEAKAIVMHPVSRVPVRSWKAFLDETGAVVGAVLRFRGYADAPTISDSDDGSRVITMTAQGAVFNLVRSRGTVLSHEEQLRRFPGDTGLSDMAKIQDQQLVWTTGAYNNFSPPA